MNDYDNDFWGEDGTCSSCKYYTDEHITLWGKVYPKMNKCSKQSKAGAVVYSLETSDCKEWEAKGK